MPEKTVKEINEKMIQLTAAQIIDLLVERYLAHVGFNPVTKKFDRKPIVCRPIVVVGPAGIGKSELPRQAAAKAAEIIGVAVGVRDCNLQFLECPDMAGLVENRDIDGERVSIHGRPNLLPHKGHGLWFLDEPNRAGRDIRSALLTLVQARRVNDYEIGKDWMLVMAMNPSTYAGVAYEVNEWDRALKDRVTMVWFRPSIEELCTYLRTRYGNHIVIRWIESIGNDVNTNHLVDFKGGGDRPTPRAIEFLIRAIEAAGGIDSRDWFRQAEAEIGRVGASALSAFVKTVRTITAEEILDLYDEKVQAKIQAFEDESRNDVLTSILTSVTDLIYERISSGTKFESPEFQASMASLARFLETCPADMRNTFFVKGGEKLMLTSDRVVWNQICAQLIQSPVIKSALAVVKRARLLSEKEQGRAGG